MAEYERDPLSSRNRGEGGERPVVSLMHRGRRGLGLPAMTPLAAFLGAVVVEQLVSCDSVDPRGGRIDAAALLQLGDRGEERLLGEVFGDRGRATAAMQEVAVDARECVGVEPAEGVGVETEWLRPGPRRSGRSPACVLSTR